MTFLSKLGKVMTTVGKVLAVVLNVGPVITALTPTKKDDEILAKIADPLTQVAGIVIQVEAMAQALDQPLPGTQKLQMAAPLVAQIILNSSIMAHKEIANPALFKQGVTSIASGMADVLNAIRPEDVETVSYSG